MKLSENYLTCALYVNWLQECTDPTP